MSYEADINAASSYSESNNFEFLKQKITFKWDKFRAFWSLKVVSKIGQKTSDYGPNADLKPFL